MIVVLSPAKTLDFETPPAIADHTQAAFLDQSQVLVRRLRGCSPAELGQLMGVSETLAVLNAKRYAGWKRPFTAANAKQAVFAFNGDVYDGLAASTLSAAALRHAQGHLRILSGLYGLLRPLDLIQPYRLEMGTPLASDRGRDLYAFWGHRLVDALNSAVTEVKARAIVNLASQEYFKSVPLRKLAAPVIVPVFEDFSAGRYKVISFYAKRARGLMARLALSRRLKTAESLKAFTEEGYAFVDEASTAARWVFRRRLS